MIEKREKNMEKIQFELKYLQKDLTKVNVNY